MRELGLALLWWVERNLCRERPGATALSVGGPAGANSSLLRSAQEAETAFRIISGHSAASCVPKLEFSWYELLLSSFMSLYFPLYSSPSSQTEVKSPPLLSFTTTLKHFPSFFFMELKLQHRNMWSRKGTWWGQVYSFTRNGGDFSNITPCLLSHVDGSFSILLNFSDHSTLTQATNICHVPTAPKVLRHAISCVLSLSLMWQNSGTTKEGRKGLLWFKVVEDLF